MKTITIEVTQEDIEKGIRKTCSLCPVALAIKRAINYEVSVDVYTIFLISKTGRETGQAAPPQVTDFILRFDAGHPVQPFTFQLEIPE